MKKISILVNGLDMPYHVVDKAISLLKGKSGSISAFFLRDKTEDKEGYAYPSDLTLATKESTAAENIAEDTEIISHNRDVIERMAKFEGIGFDSAILVGPTIEEVTEKLKGSDLVLAASDFDSEALLNLDHFSIRDLLANPNLPIELVEKGQ